MIDNTFIIKYTINKVLIVASTLCTFFVRGVPGFHWVFFSMGIAITHDSSLTMICLRKYESFQIFEEGPQQLWHKILMTRAVERILTTSCQDPSQKSLKQSF